MPSRGASGPGSALSVPSVRLWGRSIDASLTMRTSPHCTALRYTTLQLPDDPGELKLLVMEMDGELRVKDAQLAAKGAKMEAELRVKAAELAAKDEKLAFTKAMWAISNTELLRYKRACMWASCGQCDQRTSFLPGLALLGWAWLGWGLARLLARGTTTVNHAHPPLLYPNLPPLSCTDQLTIRNVIERLEGTLSPRKMRQASLGRAETWTDVFEGHRALEQQICAVLGVGAQDTRTTAVAVAAIQSLYKKLSQQIHDPNAWDVPIPLSMLSYREAALAMVLCLRLPVRYVLLSTEGVALGGDFTPEQVARGEIPVIDGETDGGGV